VQNEKKDTSLRVPEQIGLDEFFFPNYYLGHNCDLKLCNKSQSQPLPVIQFNKYFYPILILKATSVARIARMAVKRAPDVCHVMTLAALDGYIFQDRISCYFNSII